MTHETFEGELWPPVTLMDGWESEDDSTGCGSLGTRDCGLMDCHRCGYRPMLGRRLMIKRYLESRESRKLEPMCRDYDHPVTLSYNNEHQTVCAHCETCGLPADLSGGRLFKYEPPEPKDPQVSYPAFEALRRKVEGTLEDRVKELELKATVPLDYIRELNRKLNDWEDLALEHGWYTGHELTALEYVRSLITQGA